MREPGDDDEEGGDVPEYDGPDYGSPDDPYDYDAGECPDGWSENTFHFGDSDYTFYTDDSDPDSYFNVLNDLIEHLEEKWDASIDLRWDEDGEPYGVGAYGETE